MNKKTLGTIAVLVGVLLLLVSALADHIGWGGAPGFGIRQMIGTAAGVIVALAGLVVMRKK